MQVELLVNIIILCVVSVFCIVIIAVRIYFSCFRRQDQSESLWSQADIIQPDIEVNAQDLQWTPVETSISKNEECCICLDQRVNIITKCNHKFHMNCLIEWKKRMKDICPYCKGQNLSDITFYCQCCHKYKFQYHFEAPLMNPRCHMVPKFFTSFLTSENKLLCSECKVQGRQNPQYRTRNFESVKESEEYLTDKTSSERISSNKASINRQPVDICIKQSRGSLQRESQFQSENNEAGQPLTANRLLLKIDY